MAVKEANAKEKRQLAKKLGKACGDPLGPVRRIFTFK
jgi:hypothetical protein